MAGSLLGKDQVEKVNAAYPRLLAHIRSLLAADQTPHGAMKVHFLVEYLDTTGLAEIFQALPFLAPGEKKALVRVAVYDALMHPDAVVVVPEAPAAPVAAVEAPKVFTPARFTLNVATSDTLHDKPAPVVAPAAPATPAVVTNVGDRLREGAAQAKAEQAARDAAVKANNAREAAKLAAAVAPEIIVDAEIETEVEPE